LYNLFGNLHVFLSDMKTIIIIRKNIDKYIHVDTRTTGDVVVTTHFVLDIHLNL